MLHGRDGLSADSQPVMRAVDLADILGPPPGELPALLPALSTRSSVGSRKASLMRSFSLAA